VTEYDIPLYLYSRQLSPSVTVKGWGPLVTYLAIAPLLVQKLHNYQLYYYAQIGIIKME
jgi:hypothetical protein